MASEIVSEFILIIAVIVIGVAILGFTFDFLTPQIAFSEAENQASDLASSSSISVSPMIIYTSSNGQSDGSFVSELYNPAFNGTLYILVFQSSSVAQPSVGFITPTPTSLITYEVNCPNVVNVINGKKTTEATPITEHLTIYDVNGKVLFNGSATLYQVKVGTPVTIDVTNPNPNDIIVIWYIVNEGGYYFRIGYTYTQVVQ